MGKIKSNQKLQAEDFKKDQRWVEPILRTYNKFMEEVVLLINGNLIFSQNSAGVERVFDFEFDTQATTFPQRVRWPLLVRPKSLWVTSALEDGTAIMAIAAWEFTSDRFVQLTALYKVDASAPNIADLTNGSRYQIGIRAEP